jgi:hypothetical protein
LSTISYIKNNQLSLHRDERYHFRQAAAGMCDGR